MTSQVHIAERTRIMEGIEVYTCSIMVPYKFYILYMNPPGKFIWTTEPNLLENINLYLLKYGKDYFSQETEIDDEGMGKLERLVGFLVILKLMKILIKFQKILINFVRSCKFQYEIRIFS